MTTSVEQLTPSLGTRTACDVLGVPRSSVYRARRPQAPAAPRPVSEPVRALSEREQAHVRETLTSDRFADQSPREVYATCHLSGYTDPVVVGKQLCELSAR